MFNLDQDFGIDDTPRPFPIFERVAAAAETGECAPKHVDTCLLAFDTEKNKSRASGSYVPIISLVTKPFTTGFFL